MKNTNNKIIPMSEGVKIRRQRNERELERQRTRQMERQAKMFNRWAAWGQLVS